jgi:uncharacterized protein (DUF58 family)
MVLDRGNRCRLVIPGAPMAPRSPRGSDDRGLEALHRILDALARVRAEQTETAADGIAAVLPELERDSTLALITSVWDDATARAVVAAVDARITAMVIYIDPGSFRGETKGTVEAAEAVRAQIESLRAHPVLIRRGAPLADQFLLGMAG